MASIENLELRIQELEQKVALLDKIVFLDAESLSPTQLEALGYNGRYASTGVNVIPFEPVIS